MRTNIGQLRSSRLGRGIVFGGLCLLALAACAHRIAPMRGDHTVVISGHRIVGSNADMVTKNALVAAARLTLDHGCRYFKVLGAKNNYLRRNAPLALRPGADVTIAVYREGEIDPQSPDVWDAQNIAAGGL